MAFALNHYLRTSQPPATDEALHEAEALIPQRPEPEFEADDVQGGWRVVSRTSGCGGHAETLGMGQTQTLFQDSLRADLESKFPCQGAAQDGRMAVTGMAVTAEQNPCGLVTLSPKYEVWQIVFHGSVNVREVDDLSAEILGVKWKCDTVIGEKQGDWVKLADEPGYIAAQIGGATLLQKLNQYRNVFAGTCEAIGMRPILDSEDCRSAAIVLRLDNTTVRPTEYGPAGCYSDGGSSLWLSTNPAEVAHGAYSDCHPICYNKVGSQCEPLKTTTETTTSTVTTATTSWGWPSLFCFTVVRAGGNSKEPELLRLQLKHGMGIFGCEEFTAFSHQGEVTLGEDWTLVRLPDPPPQRGGFSWAGADSWLNIGMFQSAWTNVKFYGRYRRHDWTIKADPDTVFFANRLRTRLRPHTTKTGSNTFVLNCNNGIKPSMLGSLEVFSRSAVEAYMAEGWKCAYMTQNPWGEDKFMQECLVKLGSYQLYDFDMLADERCGQSRCADRSKVAYHGSLRDVAQYTSCFHDADG
eukprot:CAMPEP_0175683780 /NCGR_PEP_ID=MMETSP0097-20121207/26502_1 /TAXON_ID=311494 /ORGANISM="Alexandrium monilatum, Strain CCMP3105" /LENGTH=522 /DNA_ID=CAMNT_0016990697 /DNA_START=15 /DNA_END=1585 /DNA_ORIENTATION=-